MKIGLNGRLLFLGLFVLLLSACGFRLNGSQALSEDCSSRQIQLQQELKYGNFYRAFYLLSRQSGLILLSPQIPRSSLSSDTGLLSLSEPQFSERPLSYSSDGQTNYVMIELSLPYEIRDLKDRVLSKGPLVLARPMSVSPNALLNNDSQRELVREALIQKACQQLLQRLNADISVSP